MHSVIRKPCAGAAKTHSIKYIWLEINLQFTINLRCRSVLLIFFRPCLSFWLYATGHPDKKNMSVFVVELAFFLPTKYSKVVLSACRGCTKGLKVDLAAPCVATASHRGCECVREWLWKALWASEGVVQGSPILVLEDWCWWPLESTCKCRPLTHLPAWVCILSTHIQDIHLGGGQLTVVPFRIWMTFQGQFLKVEMKILGFLQLVTR